MSTQRITDDVVIAAAGGDPRALRAVYEGLAPSVLGYLRARGVEDGEAVTHDVFLALLPQLGRITGGATGLRTLAFSIAHARMVDDARARARRPTLISYEPSVDTRVAESAEDRAHELLATAGVIDILRLLPPDQRDVLSLRVVADLSLEQVAQIMGRSTGAVKQLQRRAVLGVRRALAEGRVTR